MNLKDNLVFWGGSLSLVGALMGLSHYSITKDNGGVIRMSEEVRQEYFNQSPSTILVTVFPMHTIHDRDGDGNPDYVVIHHAPVRGVALKTIREPIQIEKDWYREQNRR